MTHIPRPLPILLALGMKVEHKVYGGTTHKFFGMAAIVADAKDAQKRAGQRLKVALK